MTGSPPTSEAHDPLLTTEHIGRQLRISTEAARKRIQRGRIKAYKVGRRYLVRQSDIDAYIEAHPVPTRKESV